ncbi:MAG TPA: CBS domain-containing protein [Thermaerobacter sp.]
MPSSLWQAGRIARPAVYARPEDPVATVLATLRRAGYSRAPVWDGHRVTGALTARTWQRLLEAGADLQRLTAAQVQEPPLPQVAPSAGLLEVLDGLERAPAVVVAAPGRPPGIITYVDVVRDAAPYLRLRELEQVLRALLDRLEGAGPPGGWLALLPPGQARRIEAYCRRDGGTDPLDYIDLYDLRQLVEAGWERWFQPWFAPLGLPAILDLLDRLRRTRNDVAHMRDLAPGQEEELEQAVRRLREPVRRRLLEEPAGPPPRP